MKTTILLTTLVFIFDTAFAQNAIKVHTDDNMKTAVLIDNIEKITFGSLAPGDIYQGGIVFYIDASGEHGLMTTLLKEYDGMVEWYNGGYITTGATGNDIGAGADNTSMIIDKQGYPLGVWYAAWACKSLTVGGYNDWYLPSKYELHLIYTNLFQNGFGDFYNGYYWSSSEYSEDSAWRQSFDDGSQTFENKSSKCYVRAIRVF